MKKTILLLVVLLTTSFIYGQLYDPINYKMLITNNGTVVANQSIDVKISIRKTTGGTNEVVWIEEHNNVMTDDNGICALQIGFGNSTGGTAQGFEDIHWSTGMNEWFQLKVEVDLGNGYQTLVDWEDIASVPLAKQADKAFTLEDQYGATKYVGNNAELKFVATANSPSAYVMKLDVTNTSQRLIFSYQGQETMYFQGAAYTDFVKDVKLEEKLIAPVSGDADLKAYIYGRVDSNGNIVTSASSDGFTVQKTATGVYEIHFNDTTINNTNYIIVATSWAASGPEVLTYQPYGTGYFIIRSWDMSNGNLKDTYFDFVVFKK